MKRLRFVALVLLSASCALAEESAPGQKAIDLQAVPIYLPLPSFWTHALSHGSVQSGSSELDEAYRRYLDGDMLSARAHLYKARLALHGPDDEGLRLRAASLASLIDMGEINDTFLILKKGDSAQADSRSDETLLSNRWTSSGGKLDAKVAPWVELFTAYQQYRRGDLEHALAAWQRILKDEQYPADARGLGGLGVIEIAGEVLLDAKKRGEKSPISRTDAIGVALVTKLVFATERSFAVGQCILLEAQIQYIDGDREAAFHSLEAANRYFADDRSGWADTNLVGAIGEGRNGNTEVAEGAVSDVEDAIADLRVPPEQVQALIAFSKRLPAITGVDQDNRPVDLQLADAREFYRWADTTGNPLLDMIAIRTLAQVLRDGGYWTDATFFDALGEEVGKRYRASFPFVKRMRSAVLLDYDFLMQTQFFADHDLLPGGLSALVDAYVASSKGTIAAALEYLPGMTRERAEANLEEKVAPGRDIAKQADTAREVFRTSLKAGNPAGARQAVIDSANAQLRFLTLFNILGETTHRKTATETQNSTVAHDNKLYKVHAEVTSEYWISERKLTKVEINEFQACLDNAIQVLVGAMEKNENIAARGAAHIIAFYDANRAWLVPPESLDIPSMLSGAGGLFTCASPDKHEARDELIDAAEGVLRQRYREKLIPKAVAAAGFNATELEKTRSSDSAADREAMAFFTRNFVENEAARGEGNPIVTIGQEGDLPLITIKQSYKVSYERSDQSEYVVAPTPAKGIDIEGRAEAARLAWFHYNNDGSSFKPRLDELLTALYRHGFAEGMVGRFTGGTPEQWASRNSVFSTTLNAAQLALSMQRADDFILLPGRVDFQAARATLRKNDLIRRFLTAVAQADPDAADWTEQLRSLTEQFPEILNAANFQDTDKDVDTPETSPLRAIGEMVDVAAPGRARPLLFLLVDDRASADKVAAQIRARPQPTTVERVSELVLYDIATAHYADAVSLLSTLPTDVRVKDPLTFYQLDYIRAVCYRRMGNRPSEIEALRASIRELNRFRHTLVTRNEAARFQPVRQMLYEELLGALFAQKQYAAMADAIRTYRRSSALPVSVLEQSRQRDPQVRRLLDDAALAFDTLSREDLWKTEDLSGLLPEELSSGDASKPVNPRDAVLAALNHMSDVLIDQLRGGEMVTAERTRVANSKAELTVSYFVGRNGIYRVSEQAPSNLSARFVPVSSLELSNLALHFRSAIEERRDPGDAGRRLYETLLGDLAVASAVKHLNIAPDGVLNLVPFQALRGAADAPYLIQQYSIAYVTGVAVGAGGSGEGHRVLLVGNPDATLPAAESEVRAIAGIRNFQSEEPLLSNAATLDRIREQLPPVSLVHFATHARAYEAYPNFAFLQLARGERLYSYDLGRMSFAGKQVFLSACETRTGQILPGDDVYGIADAFLASGASSVVATLWRIESDSSALFAQRFYQILAETQDPSEAIAQAAREFITGQQKTNREGTPIALDAPVYWAAFNYLIPQGGAPAP